MDKKELWLSIANYHFDNLVSTHIWDEIIAKFGGESPFTKAFADKLSRKLNWEKKFAMQAIWEYKKFVFLGVISDFSVTPSKIIDQVWHEHLLFSAGYRKFCKEVIKYDFDHNPELVSVDRQTENFQTQYFHTIELYTREFGSPPPTEIWGTTKFSSKKEKTKKTKERIDDSTYYDSEPLISMFPDAETSDVEFGGGEFGGAGSGGNWSFATDSASSGDSSGSSDCGTSCSSSCGGGCGGD